MQWPNEKAGPNYKIPHTIAFDPTYGYTQEELMKVGLPDNEPDDFDAFWEDLYEKTLNVPLKIERKSSTTEAAGMVIEEIYFDTLDGVRIGGWLAVPEDGVVEHLRVQGHGYGGRGGPDEAFPPKTASIMPCAPGFHLSAGGDMPTNNAGQHVIHRIESKDTYVFRECAGAWWSAASVLLELFPKQAKNLYYSGWSYGGGMGALMLPWDKRFTKAELGQVSFCHHPIRVKCQNNGSGKAVKAYYEREPEIMDVLRYFDAAFSCKRITVPTVFACSLFDPSVCPPGQFAAHNVATCEKRLSVFLTGHFTFEHDDSEGERQRHGENLKALSIIP